MKADSSFYYITVERLLEKYEMKMKTPKFICSVFTGFLIVFAAACGGGGGGGDDDFTSRDDNFSQIDRMGQPAVNTALISSGNKDAFNRGQPSLDPADFMDEMTANIQGLRDAINAVEGFPPEDSPGVSPEQVVAIVNPDTLRVDLSQPTTFPNGRNFTDEVIDPILQLVTNRVSLGVSDGIDNDSPGSSTFPYAAPPQ